MTFDPTVALGALLRSTPDYIFFHDREGRYTYVSDAAAKALGRTPESMIGRTIAGLGVPDEASARFRSEQAEVLASRRAIRNETTYGPLVIDYVIAPLIVNDELLGTIVVSHDITEQRRAEVALRESETKWATAFGRSPLSLTITDVENGTLVDVNEGFITLSGYSREEAVGRTPEQLGLWVDPVVRADRFRRMLAGERVPDVEAVFRVKHGVELIGMVGSALVEINGRQCVLSSVVDITERKRIEEKVRRSEARFREFADSAPAMLWISEQSGQCTFISRGWLEFTGQTEAEALGTGWLAAVHPDDRDTARDTFLRGHAEERAFEIDFRVRRADGEYRWAINSARPRFDAGHAFLGHIGSVIDITDRKLAEQAKDEFLATLSHELRTPLTSAYGWVKLLGRTRDPELLDNGLRAIEESLVTQIRLIDDLLDVSRIAAGKTSVELQPIDLAEVVQSAIGMVRPTAEAKGLELRVDMQPATFVLGDAGRLRQVIWNLLANAVKFTFEGTVSLTLTRSGDHAVLQVRDTGQGIDAKFLPHVFDRFRQADSSMSRSYGGLGIGLAIVASLVEAHRGTVRADSDGAGKGATFTVTLPLLTTAMPRASSQVEPAGTTLSGARVLVVDDDPGARAIMSAALTAAGAEVRECESAGEALDAVAAFRPDVLVSDLAMPYEDGYSLIRRLREGGERVPAVAITAYARSEDEARVRDAGFQRHVAKPFDPEMLVRTVRELI